jgi:hypothetical protein
MALIAGLLGGILTTLIGIHIVLRDIRELLAEMAESEDKE